MPTFKPTTHAKPKPRVLKLPPNHHFFRQHGTEWQYKDGPLFKTRAEAERYGTTLDRLALQRELDELQDIHEKAVCEIAQLLNLVDLCTDEIAVLEKALKENC